jgi:hypothetical protein
LISFVLCLFSFRFAIEGKPAASPSQDGQEGGGDGDSTDEEKTKEDLKQDGDKDNKNLKVPVKHCVEWVCLDLSLSL